ncbi:MAG: acyltransferase family protein [Clostridiales bacterium]|nr:acyltransferase family protein [Clostridiales bacterium]
METAIESITDIRRQKRLRWIDMARGYGVILVILGHLSEDLRLLHDLIYCFHIPLFFFLSGFVFSSGESFSGHLKKKARSLLLPYFILAMISFIVALCYKIALAEDIDLSYILRYLKEIILQQRKGPIWFLPCLFTVDILFYCLVRLTKNKLLPLSVISAVLTVTGIIYEIKVAHVLLWNSDMVLSVIIFFAAGYIIKESGKLYTDDIPKKTAVITFIFALIAMVILEQINYRIAPSGLNLFLIRYGNPFLTYPCAFFGITACISFSMLFKVPFIEHIGQNTFIYFALHQDLIPLTWPLQSVVYDIELTDIGKIIKGSHHFFILIVLLAALFMIETLFRHTRLAPILCPGKPYRPFFIKNKK